jgi:cytochrome c553
MRRLALAFLIASAGSLDLRPAHPQQAPAPAPLPERIRFNRDIRPILAEYCIRCHGPDPKSRQANLRLDTKEGAFAELEPGRFAIVPGRPEQSEVWKRLVSRDTDARMPPRKAEKKPGAKEIQLLRRWIEQGAPWEGHWSFVPLEEPPAPLLPDRSWARTFVDEFILARLREEGLSPSPEADRATLARRVTLDLTGLPPTPEEVEAFVRDPAPDAYERLVDRLLRSPRYGEHMARYWLDLARYGDTHGLHLDNYREIWPYRDWVIRAFNENMPFDRFVTQQLAGDLLPGGALEALIATGFLRCHVTTNEGGSIEEEVYCRNVFDRVETFGQVFLALSFTCARCHDHKYDPITQKDYYGLFAFFNSLDGSEMDGNRKDPPPTVKVPDPEQARELARLRERAAALEARLEAPAPEVDPAQARWEEEMAARFRAAWAPLNLEGVHGVPVAAREDKSVAPAPGTPAAYELTVRGPVPPARAFKLEVLPPEGSDKAPFSVAEFEARIIPAAAPERARPVRWLAAHLPSGARDKEGAKAIDGKMDTAWTGDARGAPALIFVAAEDVAPREGETLRFRLAGSGIPRLRLSAGGDAEILKGVLPAAFGPWHVLGPFPAPDGRSAYDTEYGPEKGTDLGRDHGGLRWARRDDFKDGQVMSLPRGAGAHFLARAISSPSARKLTFSAASDDALQVWLNGAAVLTRNVRRAFRKYDANKVTLELEPGENLLVVKLSNYGTAEARFLFEILEEENSDLQQDVAAALAVPPEKRTDAQRAVLRRRYRRDRWPEWRAVSRELALVRGEENALLDQVPTTLVFRERAKPKEAFILKRGEYDHKGEKVGRAAPAALAPLPADRPPDRLALARWLLDPRHPLTARVAVNRFWQQLFGTGIVKTSEDFGLQGEPPSHPELLDALAARFVADGWDVKKLMRTLVLSLTYRQSSRVTPELARRDPENRLLARGPRFRMDAEMVRDQILFLSGLLVERVGGPSVKPPQPEGLWEAVGYTGSNTYRFQRDPEPAKVFRRSLYIFWKRTSSPPTMSLFDAPSRESCVARRERTNTPMQALMLMNEPQCFEAARHLAQKAIREGGSGPEERAAWLVRRCALRAPTDKDVADLAGLYRAQREIFARAPEEARRTVSFGDLPPDPAIDPVELAAWTMVANAVLNLDEVVTKR